MIVIIIIMIITNKNAFTDGIIGFRIPHEKMSRKTVT